MKETTANEAPRDCLIWSHEHHGWWRAAHRGYTLDMGEAGLYTLEEARAIVENANRFSPAGEIKEEYYTAALQVDRALQFVKGQQREIDKIRAKAERLRERAGLEPQEEGGLREQLQKRLRAFRYTSAAGMGERGLMEHHIEALTEFLGPWLVVQARTPTSNFSHLVHNHGPESGPGLECRESLIGDCIRLASTLPESIDGPQKYSAAVRDALLEIRGRITEGWTSEARAICNRLLAGTDWRTGLPLLNETTEGDSGHA